MSLLVYFIGNVYTGVIGGIIYLIRGTRGMVTEKAATTDSEPSLEASVNNE